MKRALIFIFILIIFQACSIFKQAEKEVEIINIPEKELQKTIASAVDNLLKGDWLSDFLIEKNSRPTLIFSSVTNKSNSITNIEKIYDSIDMRLIQSGQVRVLKSNETQRLTEAHDLASGASIDYALTAVIEKNKENNNNQLTFILSLWDENSTSPVFTVDELIE
jgi:hypothetical protein